jgi:murein L,D-transpeptidase YafK
MFSLAKGGIKKRFLIGNPASARLGGGGWRDVFSGPAAAAAHPGLCWRLTKETYVWRTVCRTVRPVRGCAATLVVCIMCAEAGAPPPGRVPSSARSRSAVSRVKQSLEAALAREGARWGAAVFVRIFKESGELEVWVQTDSQYTLLKTYEICYFSGELGPKQRVGDQQSPEGFYAVGPRQMNPASQFHLSFDLGYPNAYDRAHGRTGSALMVHGNCVSIGCYAMTDGRIEEIWALADAALRGGQSFFRVHVFPFRMTKERMETAQTSAWYGFWENLKEGYDLFEQRRVPPNVEGRGKTYVFSSDG